MSENPVFNRDHQFLLFAGQCYYPLGGFGDFQGSFPTLEEAKEAAKPWNPPDNHRYLWYNIVDIHTGEEIDAN